MPSRPPAPVHDRAVLAAAVLAAASPSPDASAQEAWPTSCRLERETIFDRPVELHRETLPIPDVPRHEPALGVEGRHVALADGTRLWVEEAGEGPPLLLVSGGPGTSHHYFHPHLMPATRFARVIWVDLRGVGLSDRARPEGGYTVDSAASDLEALREALGLGSWTIFGYSFGGTIAQAYAVRHPERLDGLVLASTALPMDVDVGLGVRQRDFMAPEEVERVAEIYRVDGEPTVPAHTERVSPELQRSMLFDAFMNGDWKRRHLCGMTPEEIARFARYEFVHDRDYYREMVESGSSLDLTGRFRDLEVPTLVMEGRWDLAFGTWKPDVMREQFPRAEVVVLEDAGHTMFEDDPAGFFSALERFMRGVEPASGAGPLARVPVLSLAAARAAVAGAREEALANGWRVTVAVVDPGGRPLLLERMDGAHAASARIAVEKARAAAEFGRPTAEMEAWVRDGGVHLVGLPGIVPVEGGVPVRVDGTVVGAIGVSGATAVQDGRVAAAAVRALSMLVGGEP